MLRETYFSSFPPINRLRKSSLIFYIILFDLERKLNINVYFSHLIKENCLTQMS